MRSCKLSSLRGDPGLLLSKSQCQASFRVKQVSGLSICGVIQLTDLIHLIKLINSLINSCLTRSLIHFPRYIVKLDLSRNGGNTKFGESLQELPSITMVFVNLLESL